MLKILILQRLYNISDEQTEYQINDRLSFMRFLNLRLSDRVPDQNTIWLFREQLKVAGVVEQLFQHFEKALEQAGMLAQSGSIVDATIVDVPRQRNNREENKQIKQGETPDGWKEQPAKLRQKDVDARWLKKDEKTYYGYKNHIKTCRKSKLITQYTVTDAAVHDSQALEGLLEKSDRHHELYGDSAYTGGDIETMLRKKKIRNRIHRKGYRNKLLSERDQEMNTKKSSVRARIEHIFGFMTTSMKGIFLRTIGKARAKVGIGLMNLTYNLSRYVYLACAQG